jgi:hypothetical protein
MKTSEKDTSKTGAKKKAAHTAGRQHEELHTEVPLSEKDEVKQAERNTQKQQNKRK